MVIISSLQYYILVYTVIDLKSGKIKATLYLSETIELIKKRKKQDKLMIN